MALQPTFIYVEAATSRINPLFLTTSVVYAPFPFCKLHNLSFEVLVTWPSQEFVPLVVQLRLTSSVLIMHSIVFFLTIFSSRLFHLDDIKCMKHERFSIYFSM